MFTVLNTKSKNQKKKSAYGSGKHQRRVLEHVDRTTMRFNICAMLKKLQKTSWPDNVDFEIQDIECISYIADGATKARRLEDMITVNYRPHTPMEQDILVGILLTSLYGNESFSQTHHKGSLSSGHTTRDI
jgi:hypothetical protein